MMGNKGRFDFGRMRESVKGPGVDTRCWIAMARVDDDPDAIRWEAPYGWVVDVTFQGGPLDQDGPVPCRVGAAYAAQSASQLEPVTRGGEVVVAIPSGDANDSPIIIAQTHNGGGCAVPETVNGQAITEDLALNTHVLVSQHNLEYDLGQRVRISADQRITLIASLVELTQNNPTQAFIRGTAFAAALQTLLASWQTETAAVAPIAAALAAQYSPLGPAPNPALAAAAAAWGATSASLSGAIGSFASRLVPGDLLSNKIKGE